MTTSDNLRLPQHVREPDVSVDDVSGLPVISIGQRITTEEVSGLLDGD